jgi:hypothetical protein
LERIRLLFSGYLECGESVMGDDKVLKAVT